MEGRGDVGDDDDDDDDDDRRCWIVGSAQRASWVGSRQAPP